MGTPVGRIEKEFIFKTLIDEGIPCDIHGTASEAPYRFVSAAEDGCAFESLQDNPEGFPIGEEVRVFFYLKNNYHTFTTKVRSVEGKKIRMDPPKGVYKNLQRKYERVKVPEDIDVAFSVKGRKIELNFPKSERFGRVEPPQLSETFDPRLIHELVKGFRAKANHAVSSNSIIMFRDRLPRSWEEKMVVRIGKSLWIPSTQEDFPAKDPAIEEAVITRGELVAVEEEAGVLPSVIASKLGNILYEKSKAGTFSELYSPILYNEYVVGYIYLANSGERREKISADIFDYAHQFSKVLCFSLVQHGYFKAEAAGERKYEAPIIDISASGLLFAHPSGDRAKDLHVHSDLDITVGLKRRGLSIGARIMRKFKDSENIYFGILFMTMAPEDFRYLFEYLYGKPFHAKYEMSWEGGSPPPPVEL
jgi:hypothetical protein